MAILGAFMVPHPPMIVPQVGRGSEKQIEDTRKAYEQAAAEIAALQPETIVIASPHTVMYADYFHLSPGEHVSGSFREFGAPQVRFEEEYDTELVKAIAFLAQERDFPAGTLGERDKRLDHGVMVPLYFIRQKYTDFRLVRLGLSGLPLTEHYKMGRLVRDAAEKTGRRVVFVASGDLSHKLQTYGPYGFAPEGPQYDRRIMDVCGRGAFGELFDFDESFCDRAAECGHRSFTIMAGALDGLSVAAKALSHEDVTGVGYGVCTFHPGEKDESRRFLQKYLEKAEQEQQRRRENADPYASLARQAVEAYVREKRRLELPEGLPSEMTASRAGVFVSIHEHGMLRGCIGTIEPTADCVGQEIIRNAVSAAARDPRFDPIRPEELLWLEISVDVLGEAEPIESPDLLDVKRYGVIVSSGFRKGLLLPDLEGVDSVEQQIAIARQKAGIAPGEPVKLQRFEVIRHV